MESKELKWTGERMVDNVQLSKGIVEHLHRYALSTELIKDKIVLDIACGEGYGSNILAKKAKYVFGIDISPEAIEHSSRKYRKENLKYIEGSALSIPLENNSVDVVVSFETLEHLTQQDEMLQEFRRVLKEDGLLIISTPEKENYSKTDPFNPYHLKELSLKEFQDLLAKYFNYVKIAHQKFMFSSFLYGENKLDNIIEYSGNFYGIRKDNYHGSHLFNIAICSNKEHSYEIGNSFFNGNEYFALMENAFFQMKEEGKAEIYKSSTYKVGNMIITPFRAIKKMFSFL